MNKLMIFAVTNFSLSADNLFMHTFDVYHTVSFLENDGMLFEQD